MIKWEPNSPPVSSFPNLILERGVIFPKYDPDKILNSMNGSCKIFSYFSQYNFYPL